MSVELDSPETPGTDQPVVMPCPRLELRWEKIGDGWNPRECVYSLVLPLGEFDIRSTDVEGKPRELALEIGRTSVRGGHGTPPIFDDGEVDTPYRDGAHARFDCKALGGHIPIIAVCEETFWNVPLQA